MADQESKVESLQDTGRNDSGIPWLRFGGVWIWSRLDTVGNAIGDAVEDVFEMYLRFRSDTTLLSCQRRSDGWWRTVRRSKVICHILNQEALALNAGKYAIRSNFMTCINMDKQHRRQ